MKAKSKLSKICAKSIVNDLIRKFPKGPNKSFKKKDYEEQYKYCNLYNRYRNVPSLVHGSWFGYDPVDLWKLVTGDASEHSCHQLVCSVFNDEYEKGTVSRMALSRRSRALRAKLIGAVSHVQSVGTEGTYKLRWGWSSDSELYTHAKSKNDARSTASVLAGLFGFDMNTEPNITFITIEAREETQKRNNKVANNLTVSAESIVKNAEERLNSANANLVAARKKAGLLLTAISMQEVIEDVSSHD